MRSRWSTKRTLSHEPGKYVTLISPGFNVIVINLANRSFINEICTHALSDDQQIMRLHILFGVVVLVTGIILRTRLLLSQCNA